MDDPDLGSFNSFFTNLNMKSYFQKKSNEEKNDGTYISFNTKKFEGVNYWYFDSFL